VEMTFVVSKIHIFW